MGRLEEQLEKNRGGFHEVCGSRRRFPRVGLGLRLAASLSVVLASHLSAQDCDAHYRWREKIDDTHVTESPTHTTVSSMLRWAVPEFSPAKVFWCRARNFRERHVYQMTAWARRLKVESGESGDGDWHIELTGIKYGKVANCIVMEIPPAALNHAYFTARQ